MFTRLNYNNSPSLINSQKSFEVLERALKFLKEIDDKLTYLMLSHISLGLAIKNITLWRSR